MSTLNKLIAAHRGSDVVLKEDFGLTQENDRLRRENRILKEEREILKNVTQFFAGQKLCGLGSSKNTQGLSKLRALCKVMDVSSRGLWAFHSRDVSRRQRSDLVTPAHNVAGLSLFAYQWMPKGNTVP